LFKLLKGRKSFDITKIIHEKKIDDKINNESYICGNCNNQIKVKQYNRHELACNNAVTPKPQANVGAAGFSRNQPKAMGILVGNNSGQTK
jgi:hypothetical protein